SRASRATTSRRRCPWSSVRRSRAEGGSPAGPRGGVPAVRGAARGALPPRRCRRASGAADGEPGGRRAAGCCRACEDDMNEETFLSALRESPGDGLTWSALADWLEDDGQAERAELVRTVRQLRTLPVMKRTAQKAALEARVCDLLNGGVRPVVPEITTSI